MIYEVFNQNSKYYRQMMDVIIAAKVNPPEKGQVHHIVPKCWFKHYHLEIDNSISNTVLLTWEDHKLVHNLAYKCAKEGWFKSKLAYACHMFGDMEPIIIVSEETRRKISEAGQGRKFSEETRRKIREGNIGKKVSEDTRRKSSESHKGNKHSAETRRKISIAMKGRTSPMKGRKLSEETKRKHSESMKGKNTWMKGRKRLEETKVKLSERYKGKHWKLVDGRRVWYD